MKKQEVRIKGLVEIRRGKKMQTRRPNRDTGQRKAARSKYMLEHRRKKMRGESQRGLSE